MQIFLDNTMFLGMYVLYMWCLIECVCVICISTLRVYVCRIVRRKRCLKICLHYKRKYLALTKTTQQFFYTSFFFHKVTHVTRTYWLLC